MIRRLLMALLLWTFMASVWPLTGMAAEVSRISPQTLKGMLGNPQVLIIDVRVPASWAGSDRKIPGAVWYDPQQADVWGPTLPRGKKIVLY